MTDALRCTLGYDADAILTAIDESQLGAREHVLACPACRAVIAVRARARGAWVAAMRDEDAHARAASEERLAYPRAPKASRVRPFVTGMAVAACVAALLVAAWRPTPPATPQAAASPALAPAPAPAPSPAPSPSAPEPAPAPEAIIASACTACRLDGARFEPGAPLRDHALRVPAGAHVTVGFALKGGLLQAANGADIDGPATARAGDGTITIEEGRARFRGVDHVKVLVPGGRIVGTGATFTLRVDAAGATRISVEGGSVSIDRDGATSPEIVKAGATSDIVRAPPPVASHASASAGAPPPASHASATPTTTPSAPADTREARRASFTAAEVELATGELTRARARLEALLTAPEPSLAVDAATLLASSHPVPAERAAVWARYLATSPPSPHRERAMIDRARALIDAGQTTEARALLRGLSGATLTEAQKRQLDRLAREAESRP